jgi:hypothetical protein
MELKKLWNHALPFSSEACCVIALRAIKLSRGGMPAIDETWRIARRDFRPRHARRAAFSHDVRLSPGGQE